VAAAPDRDPPALAEIDGRAKQLAGLLRDLRELPGYHPAHDQVIAIAVRRASTSNGSPAGCGTSWTT
jgi:hypothetical protein